MYTAFYGLREKPFVLSPNPRFLYLAESHREALAHLLYGLEQGEGFIVISGEVGTGKTTICRSLLERLGSETELGFLFNPSQNADELLQSINDEFDLESDGLSRRELLSELNRFLLEKKAESRRVVLIIDEAQNLSRGTLEQVRLLSNLETESSKLIQIILLGQPELDEMLDSNDLRQLRQRISVRWSLEALPQVEAVAYVRHRLNVAAGAERDIFTLPALREIYRRTSGVPRLMNVLCDRILLAGYAAGEHRIGSKLVRQVARELPDAREERPNDKAWGAPVRWALAAAVLLALWGAFEMGGARERDGADEIARVGAGTRESNLAGERDTDSSAGAATASAPHVTDMSVLFPGWKPTGDVTGGQPISVATHSQTEEPGVLGSAVAPSPELSPLRGEEAWLGLPPEARPTGFEDDPNAAFTAEAGGSEFLAELLARQDGRLGAWQAIDAIMRAFGVSALEGPADSVSVARAQMKAQRLALIPLGAADFEMIRRLDHPALLDLLGADGTMRTVALVRLDGEMAELAGARVGGSSLRVPVRAVEALWTGSAKVVWRRFETMPDVLDYGERSRGVMWLQAALMRLGLYEGKLSGNFDQRTFDGVKRFQMDHELEVDGVAGPLTQMILYGELEQYALPRLSDPSDFSDSGVGVDRADRVDGVAEYNAEYGGPG